MEPSIEELNGIVNDKIHLGNQLKKRFEPFLHIEGSIKISKKIQREIKFLEKVCIKCNVYNTFRINEKCYCLCIKFSIFQLTFSQ